jgi:hypothetical protein
MIHLKKISVLFIVLLAALFLICGPAAAADKTLAAGTNSGAILDTVSIPVTINDPAGVGGIAFTLTYDPAVLEFAGLQQVGKVITDGSNASYTTDELKNDLFYQWNDEGAPSARTGRAMVAAATAQALSGTNLVLFNARFKILGGNGAYPIGVVKTIIQNASAGYASPTQLPVLVGTTTPNGQGMYTSTDFPVYPATLVAGSITVNVPKFTISGSVIYQGGAVAAGSTVVLKRSTTDQGWVFDAQTTVGTTGAYAFNNKPAGTYQVFVTSNDPNYANGQSASFGVTSANVPVPQITLAAPDRLTGTVTINGGYLASLQVRVMNGTTVVGVYAVNPDGSFQTPPLPPGPTYTLWAVYGNLQSQITPGQAKVWVTTLGSIGGNIAGRTGGATVTANSVAGNLQKTTTVSGNGAYSIGDLVPANDYIVSVAGSGLPVTYFNQKTDITQANAVDISAGNFAAADFNLGLIDKGAIGGTITGSGTEAANIGVFAFETNTFALTQVSADVSGVYGFTLPPGKYEIFVIKANNKIFYYKDGAASTQSEAESTKLVLASGNNLIGKNIDITECTNVLTGKVTFERADGNPAADVLITATSSHGNGITNTGANGAYSISGLCGPYDYRVEMNPLDSRYAIQSATVRIPPAAGGTATQNFVIGAGNVLSGKITESPSVTTAIENAMIYLLDQQTGMLVNGRMYFSNITGDYTIADIPNGVDTLNVSHPLFRAYKEVDLSITADLTKSVQLVKGSFFDVTVTDGGLAQPLAGALVIVTRTGEVPVYALTDASGNCKIYGLDAANGDYIILAQKSGFERGSQLSLRPALPPTGQPVAFTLNRPALRFDLSGTITSSCSTPPAGAYVLVSTVAKDFFASAITNASGQYSFIDLPQATDYRFVVVPGGALQTHVETGLSFTTTAVKNVQIDCGSTITGTVSRTGTTPISVYLYTAANQFVASIEADAAGAYTFTGLANTTTYKVLAVSTGFSPQWYNGQTTIGTATAVSAGGTNVNITLTATP